MRDSEIGRRYADKLVRVKQKDGNETWVLVHIEIQGDKDLGMEKRMFVYHYRIFDRYEKKVVSFALLADTSENWRPSEFSYDLWGCSLDFRFPTAKILDFKEGESAAGNPPNPFSVAVAAHLKAKMTQNDMETRVLYKWSVIKSLYRAGFDRATILELNRFIDWVMALPQDLAEKFKSDLLKFEEEQNMPYVTSYERIATQQGLQQGLQKGLPEQLEEKFGRLKKAVKTRIQNADEETLTRWGKRLLSATTLGEVFEDKWLVIFPIFGVPR